MKNKKAFFFAILFMTVFTATPSFANKRCGLGSKIFGRSKGILSQFFEIYTDNLSTSSIELGTSGCKHNGYLITDPIGKNDNLEQQQHYANANYEELVVEMAKGHGATLEGFAATFGCAGGSAASFGEMTKQNYEGIISKDSNSPDEMLQNLRETFRRQEELRNQCGAV